tara:strand:+ start:114 stop:500 length:387 start_codon:yes stop_codon:yes gene_type:complete
MPTLTLPEGTNITRNFDTQMLTTESLGGHPLYVRPTTWPKAQLLDVTMINVTKTELDVLETFFETNHGIEVTLERTRNAGVSSSECTDEDEQTFSWDGIILSDPVITQVNWDKTCSLYRVVFQFFGKV